MARLLPALVLCAMIFACVEDFESSYANVAEVEKAGAGARSWLPRWLPESATNIRERHNIDSNATLVAFDVSTFSPSMLEDCTPGRSVRHRGSASWWPDDEYLDQLTHFTCEEKMVFGGERVQIWRTGVAWDAKAKRVYFWRNGR